MKKLFTLLLTVLFTVSAFAQAPQKISYQAVVRDGSGSLIQSHAVGMRIQILQTSEFGAAVYVETHSTTTNVNGLVTLEIGSGNVVFGTFAGINWAAGPYFIKTETDPLGGTSYTITGTSQLLSVPYALHAKTVASYPETDPVFGAHAANGITSTLIGNWNTAYSWGNHSGLYRPVSYVPAWSEITSKPTTVAGFGITDAVTIIGNQTIAGDKTFSNKIIATQQGIGTSTPNASSALEISSTTQGYLPPRMTQVQRDAITPVEGLIVYNTTTKIPNYYDGIKWRNYDGSEAKIVAIGDSYRGGIVAYILQSGDAGYIAGEAHGLIAAPSDQITGAQWGCIGTAISGADGTAIGTGNQNTIDIVTGCTTAGIPAKVCYDLTLNGYSDWYLPSKDELNQLYLNRAVVGGFVPGYYWSSTETNNYNAWVQYFSNGFQYYDDKGNPYYVRAVRAF